MFQTTNQYMLIYHKKNRMQMIGNDGYFPGHSEYVINCQWTGCCDIFRQSSRSGTLFWWVYHLHNLGINWWTRGLGCWYCSFGEQGSWHSKPVQSLRSGKNWNQPYPELRDFPSRPKAIHHWKKTWSATSRIYDRPAIWHGAVGIGRFYPFIDDGHMKGGNFRLPSWIAKGW